MSWDMMAFKVPPEFKSAKDLPKDWEPEPFGLQTEVRAKITALLPEVGFDLREGGLWGTYVGDGFSLEICLGKTEPINHLWVAVRGDMKALSLLAEIVDAFALRGLDLQRGEFFDPVEARKSFVDWHAAVDRYRKTNPGPV